MKKRVLIFGKWLMVLSILLMSVAACSDDSDDDKEATGDTKTPKYVFYFIGDGMGAAQRQSAEFYKMQVEGETNYSLYMDKLPVAGINTTYSTDSMVTDSAAAGTALATGYKTNNGVIAKLPDGTDVKSIIEAAEEKGMKTGIVTSTRITHATPAVFASHNMDRNDENGIAVDYLDSGVDYFAGGGYNYFVGRDNAKGLKSKRNDDRDLVVEFENLGYITFVGEDTSSDFNNYQVQENDKVLALVTGSHLPYEIDREDSTIVTPSLSELTQRDRIAISRG